MADKYNIYKKCNICEGNGVIEVTEEGQEDKTCNRCEGTGERIWGEMREEPPA